MAMRCFGRRGFGTGVALSGLRNVDLATIFGAGDFFCAVVRAAALEVGFCLAINLLPFVMGSRLAQFSLRRVGKGALAPCPPFTRAWETLWWARREERLCPPYGSRLMQPEHAVDGAQFGRLDQLGMRHSNREQRTFQPGFPEGEKILQRREIREQVVVLPDIGLQQPVAIRAAVDDFRRGQAVAQDLLAKVLGDFAAFRNPNPRDHANLHCWSASATVARPRA